MTEAALRSSATPRVLLVDSSRPASNLPLWGMSIAERVLRQASLCGIEYVVVYVGSDVEWELHRWRPDLRDIHPLQIDVVQSAEQLADVMPDLEGGLLVADGDVVHDDRLWHHLLAAGPDHCVTATETTLVWLSAQHWHAVLEKSSAQFVGVRQLAQGLNSTTVEQLDTYVPELRLTMPAFMIRLTERSQLRHVDHLLYRRTFKGVIDAIARYGYYHLVRLLTRCLSRTTLSPNLFTVLSIAGIWLAIPCFATGHVALGCVSAWAGVLLDSIDGKLARLTLNLSDAMGTIEHLSAMPGLGLWFVAIGWHLTDGDLWTPSVAMLSCWTTVACFLVDKVVSGEFRRRFGRELFDARPFDAFFHLFAVRRNMHLLVLTIGVAAGLVESAFVAMAAGMVLTLAIHVLRFAWIGLTGGVRGRAEA
ncbi:MAG: CDP-alcohol phosphatidyltransferase family protein [Candidatus Latescibacterota bacterium]|nr:CDP-alcohol phosphatidyltransferase family protein [Candidatus Latescibacterota bacterium]